VIDYTITIGNIIEISAIVGGGLLALVTLRSTVNNLKDDMIDMKEEIKKVLGRSPDIFDAMALTFAYPVRKQMPREIRERLVRRTADEYDPYTRMNK
jgi:hypothetical protein